jgi:hypothetical protein
MRPAPMLLAIIAAILFTFVEARPPAAEGPYQLIKEVPIGGDGGWDLTTDAIVGEIADTPGIHGAVPGVDGK